MTATEAETKRRQAVAFLRRIGRDEDADRFEEMNAAEYADHKGAEIRENPKRRLDMARKKTADQIQADLDDANDYIEELEEKLDNIAGIASGGEDDETDDSEEDDDDNGDDDDQD